MNFQFTDKPLELYFSLEHVWLTPLTFFRRLFREPAPESARRLMIGMMARIADADGIRQQQETLLLEASLTKWFGESQDAKIAAFRMLREIRSSPESFESYAKKFASIFSWSTAMRANAFDILCSIAFADGALETKEEKFLMFAATILKIPPEEVRRLGKQYGRIRRVRVATDTERGERASGGDSRPPLPPEHRPHHWSDDLGCSPSATVSEVKRVYRKLVMMYHPDRLKAHGLPQEQLRLATERFLRIQSAYDQAIAQLGR